jgi:peptide/nickel transport system ATP-binding protein
MLITHDLGMAAEYCKNIVVMEKGKIVEKGSVEKLFNAPEHDYTKKLIAATPTAHSELYDLATEPMHIEKPLLISDDKLLEVNDLHKNFRVKKGFSKNDTFHAVKGISFSIKRGECVGLVGESGCGKSTTSRMIAKLDDLSEGQIIFDGEDIGSVKAKDFINSKLRKEIQMVFQDPSGSLNPRHTVFDAIVEPLKNLEKIRDKKILHKRVLELCQQVDLDVNLITRLPHQLSGGQKARVGIARAIAVNPKLVILDEPTSALDVSVQAIVLQLLEKLRHELGLSYLFVSHDLNVVRLFCQRVLVMCNGEIVEDGNVNDVFNAPTNEYTKSLLDAIPHFSI